MRIENWPIERLSNWDNNPREASPDQLARLRWQIENLEPYKPLLVEEDGTVLGGNMRLRVMLEMGIKEVTVSIVSAPTEQRKIEYAYSDNDHVGTYVEDRVRAQAAALPEIDLDKFNVTIGDGKTLRDMLPKSPLAVNPNDGDAVGEKPPEPKSKRGEIYQLGEHRLMCGDATNPADLARLIEDVKATMVFTDPPFGNDMGYGRGQLGERKIENDENPEVMKNALPLLLSEAADIAHIAVWVQWRTFADLKLTADNLGMKLRTVVVWDKKQPGLSGGGLPSNTSGSVCSLRVRLAKMSIAVTCGHVPARAHFRAA